MVTLHILEVGDSLLQFLQTPPPDGQRVQPGDAFCGYPPCTWARLSQAELPLKVKLSLLCCTV